jgi:hypothetical protein
MAQQLALSGLYGVPLDYLISGKLQATFQFRGRVSLTQQEKKEFGRCLVAAGSQLHAMDQVWERLAEVPRSFVIKMQYSHPQLESVAEVVRGTLGLNKRVTFSEPKEALAERDVHEFEWHMAPKLSGFSY